MTNRSQIAALPDALRHIADAKRARIPAAKPGMAMRERERRQHDIDVLESAARILGAVAARQDDFRTWWRSRTGAEL